MCCACVRVYVRACVCAYVPACVRVQHTYAYVYVNVCASFALVSEWVTEGVSE